MSAHPSLVPFQVFPTADSWIVVACAKEKFWQRFAAAIGRGNLAEDPRFSTPAGRYANRELLISEVGEVLRARTTTEWLNAFGPAGVPCAQVNDVAQAFSDEHAMAREMIVETAHPRWGTVRSPASPVKVGTRSWEHRRAPLLNEDGAELLKNVLGYSPEAIEHLRAELAFGDVRSSG